MSRKQYRAKPPVVRQYSLCKEGPGRVSTIPDDISWNFLDKECVGVREATVILDISNSQYTRQLLWAGMIEGVLVDKGKVPTWYITRSSLKYYWKHHRRAAKPKRYDLRIFPVDERRVVEALDKLGITYTLEVAYKPQASGDGVAEVLVEGGDS
jgi:hypothetical protein